MEKGYTQLFSVNFCRKQNKADDTQEYQIEEETTQKVKRYRPTTDDRIKRVKY